MIKRPWVEKARIARLETGLGAAVGVGVGVGSEVASAVSIQFHPTATITRCTVTMWDHADVRVCAEVFMIIEPY